KCTCCKLKLANETNINLKENNNNLDSQLKSAYDMVGEVSIEIVQLKKDLDATKIQKQSLQEALDNTDCLATKLANEKSKLREIIIQQRDALEAIARGAIFKHAKIAHNTLKEIDKYKKDNNIL